MNDIGASGLWAVWISKKEKVLLCKVPNHSEDPDDFGF